MRVGLRRLSFGDVSVPIHAGHIEFGPEEAWILVATTADPPPMLPDEGWVMAATSAVPFVEWGRREPVAMIQGEATFRIVPAQAPEGVRRPSEEGLW